MAVVDKYTAVKSVADKIKNLFPASKYCSHDGFLLPEDQIDFGQGFGLVIGKVIVFQVAVNSLDNGKLVSAEAYLVRYHMDVAEKVDKLLVGLVKKVRVELVTTHGKGFVACEPNKGVSPTELWQFTV